MKTFTKKTMERNCEIIKEFTKKYRKECTTFGAVIVDNNGTCSAKDYIEFMNSLSEDLFAGNYLTSLLQKSSIAFYEQVLNGEMTYEDFVIKVGYGFMLEDFRKMLKKY